MPKRKLSKGKRAVPAEIPLAKTAEMFRCVIDDPHIFVPTHFLARAGSGVW
jgi:hypothetical protein